MKEEFKLNRLETTALMGPLVDTHWRELRTAKERGEKVAWCAGPPFIFAYAMGMKCHFMAGYASYVAGRKAGDQVLEAAAEVWGELPDTCSYHRLHTGMAGAVSRGLPIKEEVILPLPDLLITGRLCVEQIHYGEALYRRMGIPVVSIDIPPVRHPEEYPMAEEFLYRQIKETLIPTLEDVCGKPFDYDRMWQILITTKKAAMLRKQCMELFKVIPAPWTLWDSGISIAPVVHLAGKPEAVAYMEKLKAELDHRVANKIPAILPEERYRLYWDNFLPWAFLGKIIRKLVPFGAIPVCGRYPFMFAPHPEHIPDDPMGDPVRVWVEGIYRYGERVFGVPEIALQAVSRQVEEHSVDGLIMFTSKSCRIFNLGQQDILDEIERRYGIPGVIIEGDMVDSKMLSEAQIDTRLQALFETIEGRRRAKRRWV